MVNANFQIHSGCPDLQLGALSTPNSPGFCARVFSAFASRLIPWTGAVALIISVGCAKDERIVFKAQSPFQEVVVTEAIDPSERAIRTLSFGEDGVVQSRVVVGAPEELLVPYVRASMAAMAFVEAPRRVLVIGLGGGSIPLFLQRSFPTAIIDAVELDPVVIDVAQQWFGVTPSESLRLVEADGRNFLEEVAEPYDLIFLDAFGRDSVPPRLSTVEFLASVTKALDVRGAVVANLWNERSNSLYPSMLRTYQEEFDALWQFEVPQRNNVVLVALPEKSRLTRAQIVERLEMASQRLPGLLRLHDLKFRNVSVPRAGDRGSVLTDQDL